MVLAQMVDEFTGVKARCCCPIVSRSVLVPTIKPRKVNTPFTVLTSQLLFKKSLLKFERERLSLFIAN